MTRLGRLALILTLLALYPVVRRLPWKSVWVINAGTPDDVRHFAPMWLASLVVRTFTLVPTGFFYTPGIGVSLVVGTLLDNDTLMRDRESCDRLVRTVQSIRAKRIALNGVIPAAIYSHDLWPEDRRLMREPMGTIHMIRENLAEIEARHPESLAEKSRVAIIGVGHTGSLVANHLAEAGYAVLAFDARAEAAHRLSSSVDFAGLDMARLETANVVVFLTTRGDDAAKLVFDSMTPGTIVLSDTHPKLSRTEAARLRARGVMIYESALTRPGTFFLPKIPRWPRDTIPGCIGQTLVEVAANRSLENQAEFEQLAPAVLRARLDEPEAPARD